MSASREKKQRQKEPVGTPAVQKKNTGYVALAVICSLLVVALLVWNFVDKQGYFVKNQIVATVGDQGYTVTELGYYYYQTANMYTQYGITVDDSTRSMILTQALDSLHLYAALAQDAQANGYSLDDEGVAEVASYISQIEASATSSGYTMANYVKAIYGDYMTEALLEECLLRDQLALDYYTDYSENLNLTDSDLETYYSENADDLDSYLYSTLFINGAAATLYDTDGTVIESSDADIASANTLAQVTAEQFDLALAEEGADFNALAEEFATLDASSLATAESVSLGSMLNSTYKEWLTDASRQPGDVTRIDVEGTGVWFVQFEDRALDTASYGDVDIRHILIKAELEDDATTATQEAMDAAQAEAQALLDEFLAGEQTGEAFGALAEANSDDTGSNTNGGMYSNVTTSTSFFTDFMSWIFADGRQEGDTGLVENTQSGQEGWHVLYMDSQNQLAWEATATTALESERLTAWTDSVEATYALTSYDDVVALVG